MIKIIQGEKKEFIIQLGVKDLTEVVRPFDLTDNTEITVKWKHSGGVITRNRVASVIGVTVIGNESNGKISAVLYPAETDALPKTSSGLLEISVSFSATEVKKFQVPAAFEIVEDL